MLTVTIKFKYLKSHVRKSNLQEMANFSDYPGDNQTLIWRLGETVQNLESPRLSGRVDSPGITILWQ